MKRISILSLFIFSTLSLLAQSELSVAEKLILNKASMAYNNDDYNTAMRLYKSLLNDHEKDGNLNYFVGRTYYALNLLEDAKFYMDVASESTSELEKDFYLDYGRVYLKFGEYQKARDSFEKYPPLCEKEKELLESGVMGLISICDYSMININKPVKVNVVPLSDSINSEYSDGVPSITADGQTMVYTSRRPINKGGEIASDGQHFQDIYMASWNNESNEWGKGFPIEGSINTEGHDAATSISPDGSFIYIYQNQGGVDNLHNTGAGDVLYSKKGSTGRWSKAKIIEGVNSTYFETSACVTSDGKTMYFVSERERGGKGRTDIWMSERIGKTEWSKPVNLGDVINTPENEISVFIHPDGKTLFFASEGHSDKNFGGYDIFKSVKGEDGKWSEPENLGYPINTYRDEMHFVLTTDGKVGYFTTQRDGKRYDSDIYMIDFAQFDVMTGVTKEVKKLTIIKGVIEDNQTGRQIEANVVIKETETGETFNVTSDDNGEYFNTLEANKEYEITVTKSGYSVYNQKFILPAGGWNETITFENIIKLDREEKIEIVDKKLFKTVLVRFTSDKMDAEIADSYKADLDLLVDQLSKVNSLKVRLTGHTDNTDSDNEDDNKEFSKKRAEQVAKYLKSKGIESNRIVVFGQGSGVPVADNSSEEGRAENRRVEIRIFE